MIILLGLGAAYAATKTCSKILFLSTKAVVSVNGSIIGRTQSPHLWSLVDDVSRQLNTSTPERIIFSLDDKICVTEAQVQISDQSYSGRTLILSLPLVKQLTEDQTKAIIAHEMAHFSGGDTKFALRFFPIFRGAQSACEGVGSAFQKFGGMALAALPALVLINNFLESFAKIEAQISRSCEKEADIKAASVAGHSALVSGLVAIHGLSYFWRQAESTLFKVYHEDRRKTDNMVSFYEHVLETSNVVQVIQTIFASAVPHPFNSHPTLKQRIEYLGESEGVIKKVERFIPQEKNRLITSIAELSEIEARLTEMENYHNTIISKLISDAARTNSESGA